MNRASSSTYQEYAPPGVLRPWLVCFWTQRIGREGEGYVQRIMPDGCIDIVWIDDLPGHVVGPMTRPVFYPLRPATQIIGVRFRPGAAAGLLRVAVDQLTDREVSLTDFWGETAARFAARLGESRSLIHKLHLIGHALQSRCCGCPPDRLLTAAVDWLAHRPGGEVQTMADELGISLRQLHRRFRVGLGYGPKLFQRIMRFQRLLHMAGGIAPPPHPLAALAIEAGYADQPHMTREFQALARGTPGTLVFDTPSALAMSDLFKT